jgi:hypothetical protein
MLYPVIPSAAAGVFQRSVTPPDPLFIATKLSGASWAASASGVGEASGVGDSETVADSVGVGAASSAELFRLETIKPRIKIPSNTKSVTRLELFLAGAAAAVLGAVDVVAFGVVETIVFAAARVGTGGITILAETDPRFADFFTAFLTAFFAVFFAVFLTAFLAGRFTAFLAEDFFAEDFFAGDFFAGRFAALLAGAFFAAFFFAATFYSLIWFRVINAGRR